MGLSRLQNGGVMRAVALGVVVAALACSSERPAQEPRAEPDPEPRDAPEPELAPGAGPTEEPVAGEPEPPAPEPFELDVITECEPLRARAESTLRVERDIVYSTAGGEPITLDLVGPRTDELRPAVLLIHGGGWRRGEKAHCDSMARALAGEGFVGVPLDFRLAHAPDVVFPAPIADARCAVRWLRAHGPEHGVDPDRIAAVGFSSGGHMAAMLATAADVDGLDEEGCRAPVDTSPRIQAAAVWFAPLDLRRRIGRYSSRMHVVNLLGAPPEDVPERAALASPVTHATADDAPVLLVHGTEDPTVDPDQSRGLRDALAAVGAPVAYAELEGAGHGFGLLSREPVDRPGICTTMAFLRQTLGR